MKIFVSSTVKDLGDLRDELYRRLKELGHTPWFSEKDDFPTNRHPDAMTNCLKVAEECELFIVLLDKRAGLPYSKKNGSPYPELFGLTISEAEYRCAKKKGKQICIFIRKRAENECALYRQIDEGQRKKLKLYSEPGVYEFYERLMHEKPDVPWRYTFDSIIEILGPLNAVIGEVLDKSSVFYSPASQQPYFIHVYPLQKNFTGRVAERNMLTEWFTKGRQTMLVLNAIGGMGKTALSWYWVHEDVIKGGLAPHGIIWFSFYEKGNSFENFLNNAILYVTGGKTNPNTLQSTYEKMIMLRNVLYNNKFLLVLDGVERVLRAYGDMSAPYQGDDVRTDEKDEYRSFIDPNLSDFIKALASSYPKTKTLLTSRLFPRELDDMEGCIKKDLAQLDKEDAVEFFKKQGVKGTRAEIDEVCDTYGSHPLSLRLLSGMIIHDLKYNGDIKSWTKYNPMLKLIQKEHHVLELAYNSLDKKKQAFVSNLSAFRNPMDYYALLIFNDFNSEEKFNDALLELIERGLLFRDEKRNKFDLHPIVRKYCYARLINKDEVHSKLKEYFAKVPKPKKIESMDDLTSDIELFYHTIRSRRYDEAWELYIGYLFSWDKIPGNDNVRLIEYLTQNFNIDWVKTAKIEKIDDGNTIRVTNENNYLFLRLNDVKPMINLEIDDGRTEELAAETENGNRNISKDRLWKLIYYRFGAYNTQIELLEELLISGTDELPNLSKDSYKGQFYNELGNSYALSGQPIRSIALFKKAAELREKNGDKKNLTVNLTNLALDQLRIGKLDDAEYNIIRRIEICRDIDDKSNEAVGHRELGRVFAYKGDFEEAEKELVKSTEYWDKIDDKHKISIDELYRAICSFLMFDVEKTLNHAEKSRKLVDNKRYERNIIYAEYLIGAAYIMKENLILAEKHITAALTRDKKINMVDLEPDILLEFAKLRFKQNHKPDALKSALESLYIADRCEYRLKQADIHNFLSEFYLDAGDIAKAREHGEIAKERAECGYVPALERAEKLLKDIDLKKI